MFRSCAGSFRSAQWRRNFARSAGTPPLSKSNVGWNSEFELARQVSQHLGLIEELTRDDEAKGDEIRKNLLNILDRSPNENYLSGALELNLELAMLIDAVQPLVILCYKIEGDTALKCATAFDKWIEILDHLQGLWTGWQPITIAKCERDCCFCPT